MLLLPALLLAAAMSADGLRVRSPISTRLSMTGSAGADAIAAARLTDDIAVIRGT